MRSVLCYVCMVCVLFGSSDLLVMADTEMSGDGATADVLGQSGKIVLTYEDQSTQITISSITEVDSSGNTVGNTGPAAGKHSFNSFATQDFTFSDVQEKTFQGLETSYVNFTCSLVDNVANLTVDLYLFLENGNTTIDSRNYTVSPGSFKFSYYLSNWPFCTIGGSDENNTLCIKGNSEQEGAFLDFEIILKAVGNAQDVSDNNGTSIVTYDDESNVVLPNKYQVDGEWFTMPDGYPLTENQGSQQIVTFRFARFSGTVDYDPFVNWGSDSANSNSNDDIYKDVAGGQTTVIVVCVVGGVLLIALLAYCFAKACGKKSTI